MDPIRRHVLESELRHTLSLTYRTTNEILEAQFSKTTNQTDP